MTLIRGLKPYIFTAFTVGSRINLGAPTKRHNSKVNYTQMPKNTTGEIIIISSAVLVKLELVGKKYIQLEQQ